jgi:hypothetical protein
MGRVMGAMAKWLICAGNIMASEMAHLYSRKNHPNHPYIIHINHPYIIHISSISADHTFWMISLIHAHFLEDALT